MPTSKLNFSATIDDWCLRQVPDAIKAVRDQAAEEVIDRMREYTPVDFGFLAGTIQATVDAPVPIDPSATNEANAHISADASKGEVALVIAGAPLGSTIYGTFTMAYAGFVNYGTSKMAPRAMLQRAALEWPQIVDSVVSRAKAGAS
jgi:hypothetical protein